MFRIGFFFQCCSKAKATKYNVFTNNTFISDINVYKSIQKVQLNKNQKQRRNKSHGLVWMAMGEVWHQCSNVFTVTCQSMVSCVLIGSHFNCSLQPSEKLNSRPAHYVLPAIISPMVIWSHGFLWGLVAMVPPVTVWIPLNSGRTHPPVSCQLFCQMSLTTFTVWPYKLPIHL